MGIKDIDSIDEKKGTLGRLDLLKKGLRQRVCDLFRLLKLLGRLDLLKKGLRR